jgi:hypothetical protein
MNPAFQNCYGLAGNLPQMQNPTVASHARKRKVGDLGIGDSLGIDQDLSQPG